MNGYALENARLNTKIGDSIFSDSALQSFNFAIAILTLACSAPFFPFAVAWALYIFSYCATQ